MRNPKEMRDHDAELIFQGLFGTYDIHRNETLHARIPFTSEHRRRHRWILGGVDRLFNTVHGVGKVLIQ